MTWLNDAWNKLNQPIALASWAGSIGKTKAMPIMPDTTHEQNHEADSQISLNLYNAYDTYECVNRGVNLIADSCSSIPIDVGDEYKGYISTSFARKLSKVRLSNLLNIAPNPDQDRVEFFTGHIIDLMLTGNSFTYFDGNYLYRLPALYVKVVAGRKNLISHYLYAPNGIDIRFEPEEIIRVKEGSATNPYIGTSRLTSAMQSLDIITKMNTYQRNYFKNSTVLGVVLLSKNILGSTTKTRLKQTLSEFNPSNGAKNAIVLDGDVQLQNISQQTNKDLDYDTSLKTREFRVLEALGVPPILLDTANNTSIPANLKLFYITTILPIMGKYISAYERYFGMDLKLALSDVPAMLPDARERSASLQALVNTGIITRNEARSELRYPAMADEIADKLILPANIAGSAVDPNAGGRPPNASDK